MYQPNYNIDWLKAGNKYITWITAKEGKIELEFINRANAKKLDSYCTRLVNNKDKVVELWNASDWAGIEGIMKV